MVYFYKEGSERLISRDEDIFSKTVVALIFCFLVFISGIIIMSPGSMFNNDYEYFAINGEPVLNSEYYYYYKNNLNNLKLRDINFDGTESLDNKYDEEITYSDYLKYMTIDSLRKKYILMDAMSKDSFKVVPLSEEDILASEKLKHKASSLKDYTFDEYLKEVYSISMTKEKFINLSKEDNYIKQYEDYLIKKDLLSEDQIVAKYKNNPEYYYTVDYIEYNLGSAINDEEAKELFKSISSKSDLYNLIEEIEGDQVDIDSFKKKKLGMYAIGDKIKSDWLYSKDRKPNSMAILKNDDETYSILMYISKGIDRSEGWTFRSIFLSDKLYESKEEREDKAKEIVSEFRDSNSTESSFITLANQYSIDAGGSLVKNYYERIFEEDSIIDPEVVSFLSIAKPGDLKTIHLDKGSYIVLFKEKTEERWLEHLISLEETQIYEDIYKKLFNENKSQLGVYPPGGNAMVLDTDSYINYSFVESIK